MRRMYGAIGAMVLAASVSACSGEKPQPKAEPAVPAAEMKTVEEIEGNADVPAWVTSRTFPGLTYVKYSEYRKATVDDLSAALDRFGGDANAPEAVEYWEEQGISSAKEAQFEAHVTEGNLLELCKFALGRLPDRSVVLIRNFDTEGEASANMYMGAGTEPGGCEKP